MILMRSLALTACLSVFSVVSFADTINAGAATFTSLTDVGNLINNDGGEFFDNDSDDGPTCGIGHILTGTSIAGCLNVDGALGGLTTGNGLYSYLNLAGGPAPFSITPSAGTQSITTLFVEIAGYRDNQRIGWTTDNGATVTWLTPAVNTPNPVTGSITTNLPFQFVVDINNNPADRFLSGSSGRFALFALNSATTGMQTGEYVIGFEDGGGTGSRVRSGLTGFGDADFQDIVMRVQVVPEPATVTALGAAVLATIVAVRRRRNKA